MEDKAVYEVEEIKAKLIVCCINCNAQEFLPYLLSPLIIADFPNKIRFYGFLKIILKSAGEESEGVLELRIEREAWDEENVLSYNFYDEAHKYPRINLKVKEVDNKLHLEVFKWFSILTATLRVIHSKGITHHDIKPENILFTKEGKIKIADSGVANKETGTRSYLCPGFFTEQNKKASNIQIDIYALGVILMEVLKGNNYLLENK